ncbi:MAG: transposase [Nitrospirae bacterium]|nr:transposase [Nitrospirota bacterium]
MGERRRIRLDRAAYRQGHAFSLTLCTADRAKHLERAELVDVFVPLLRRAADSLCAEVFAYCFMPDHLHLLLRCPAGGDVVEFVRMFKILTTHEGRKVGVPAPLWQRSFYDHALRLEESIEKVARYIWENPVRRGLVSDYRRFPHSGSFVWADWKTM